MLRSEWGDKACDHPLFDRTYDFGKETGDHACQQCGKLFSKDEREAIETHRVGASCRLPPE